MSITRPHPVNQAIRINILRATFLLLLPLLIFTRPVWSERVNEVIEFVGLACVIAAVLGRFWAILFIGGQRNHQVMQMGPYSICRHPLYLFSTIGVLGLGLMLGSIVLMLLLGGLTFVILSATARKEEAFLRGRFGPDYDTYAARVPMILPRLSGFQTDERITVSIPHLHGNLKDGLVFLAFIPFSAILQSFKKRYAIPGIPVW